MTDSKLPDDQEKFIFEIYQKAIELDGEAQLKYIDEATEDDKKLKDAVNDLVASSEQAEQEKFMHTLAADLGQLELSKNTSQSDSLSQENEQIPPPIGNYKPTRLIGEGGFGKVYLAEQFEPVTRKVALKLIRHELVDERFIKRFEAERQMLAVLNHPNIAQIYDAGATREGRPFLVMEFVDGVNVLAYCKRNQLSINSRLKIFSQVCHAIQHAHQKGVVHRDIKPGNILVSEVDGQAQPKVIDFGISKALNLDINDKTMATCAEFFGSPSYMSPEQLSQNETDIDTRSDVYSLGILLYELLTDSIPFSGEQSFIVLMNQIISDEPTRPSIKASQLDREQLVALNYSNASQIQKDLADDLDWIILKALKKDRDSRYSSASAFAAEINRYLSNEPVLARAPTLTYRTGKFVSRHLLGVMASAIIVIILIAGVIGTSVGFINARDEAIRAKQAELNAQQTITLLQEFLTAADPRSKGKELKVVELLEGFKPKLEQLVHRPEIQASLMYTYAKTYFGLGLFREADYFNNKAIKIRKKILMTESRDSLISSVLKIDILRELGQYKSAEKWGREVIQQSTKLLGSEHPTTLSAMSAVADVLKKLGKFKDAEKMHRETLEKRIRILGEDHLDTIYSNARLAVTLGYQTKFIEALEINQKVLSERIRLLGSEHPLTLNTMNNLAFVIGELGGFHESEKLHRKVYQKRMVVLGSDHPDTSTSLSNLAWVLNKQAKYHEAEKLQRNAWEIEKQTLGEDHPDTLVTLGNLATALEQVGEMAEAERLHYTVWQKRSEILGEEHPATLAGLNDFATVLAKQMKYLEAKKLFKELVVRRSVAVGKEHIDTLTSMGNLAWVLAKLKDYPAAVELNRKTLIVKQSALGEEHPSTLSTLDNLSDSLMESGETEEAEKLFRQAWQSRQKVLGKDHPRTIKSMMGLSKTLEQLGRKGDSKNILQQALTIQIKSKGEQDHMVKTIRKLIEKSQ